MIVMISNDIDDSFHEFPDSLAGQMADMSIEQMHSFVREHGSPVALTSTEDVDMILCPTNCYDKVEEEELRETLREMRATP